MCAVHCGVVFRHVLGEQSGVQFDQWVDHREECRRTHHIVVDIWILEDLRGYLCTGKMVLACGVT